MLLHPAWEAPSGICKVVTSIISVPERHPAPPRQAQLPSPWWLIPDLRSPTPSVVSTPDSRESKGALWYKVGGKRKSLRGSRHVVLNSKTLSTGSWFTVIGYQAMSAGTATGSSRRMLIQARPVMKTEEGVQEEWRQEVRNPEGRPFRLAWQVTRRVHLERTLGIRLWGLLIQRYTPRRHVAMSGNIFGCHTAGPGRGGSGVPKARDTAERSTMHRTAPHTKELFRTKCQACWAWETLGETKACHQESWPSLRSGKPRMQLGWENAEGGKPFQKDRKAPEGIQGPKPLQRSSQRFSPTEASVSDHMYSLTHQTFTERLLWTTCSLGSGYAHS